MANRVISDTGGNWNNTATWVGGVIPLAADTISATTTSGSLVINVAATCAGLDLQLYTSTLEMRQAFIINGTILRLGASMNITAPLGEIGTLRCRQANTLTSNGCVVPYFAFSFNTNLITRTLQDNWTIENYLAFRGNSNNITNGFAFNITNMKLVINEGATLGRMNGTTEYRFNGANCVYDASLANPNTIFQPIGNPIYIDTPGTFEIINYISVNPYTTTTSNVSGIYHIQGDIIGDKRLIINIPSANSNTNTTYKIDLGATGTWDEIAIGNNSLNRSSTFELLSNLYFNDLYISPIVNPIISNIQTRQPILFTGVGALKGGNLYSQSMPVYQASNLPSPTYPKSTQAQIKLNTGVSHTLTDLSLIGGGDTSQFNPVEISSISGGTQASLSITGNTQNVLFTDFTDIDASGGNIIYTYKGTISNSDNILSTNNYVPTSSNTFLNG
jgi:hypothetical protein